VTESALRAPWFGLSVSNDGDLSDDPFPRPLLPNHACNVQAPQERMRQTTPMEAVRSIIGSLRETVEVRAVLVPGDLT